MGVSAAVALAAGGAAHLLCAWRRRCLSVAQIQAVHREITPAKFKTPAKPEEPKWDLDKTTPRSLGREYCANSARFEPRASPLPTPGVDTFPRFLASGVRGHAAAQENGAEAAAAMGEAGGAEEACRHIGTKEEFVKVRKKDLERLTTEVMQIRDFLPRILNGEVLESFQKLKIVEKNLERKEQELEQLKMDCEHFKARLEIVQADSIRDKKEKLALRQQLNEAKQQLLQQAEYCTEMGAAACTLLWGVSSSEEVVKAILGGDKALKFFSITGQTMESFVKSLDGDIKELDSDENQFVFALAGIVTTMS
ncbi:heat shock factor 2-binding protein [Piliocolobus tephrosceles]|uniref:heat shock factor 2-binding protein n=1 Tax=Piliocolobus tephrosceles TaxID=591936 RepID=UPI000E6AEACF|nr:heat shock factor 2-binding protein [Piliocolobus tephrosceles]